MSVTTETRPVERAARHVPQVVAHEVVRPRQTKRWIDWVTTTDHKKIGILYLVTTFVFFGLGGVEALMMRLQLGVPNNTLLSGETYNELMTMHGTTMIFLFVVPVMAGFGNYFVPLDDRRAGHGVPAAERALLLAAALRRDRVLRDAFFHPPEAGWWSYPPLSSIRYSPSGGQDAWIFLIHITGISSLLGAINFYATIVNMRAPGMSWGRLPLFIWGILVYAVLLIIALPVVAAAVTMLLTDRHFGTHFFDPTAHGSPILWQHLFWFFGHPEVYIMILPGFGIISEVIPVFSRKPIFGYKAIAASTAVIAFLATLVWAHHMFVSPIPIVVLGFFMLSSFLIGIPTGVKIFNWIATLWRGSIVMTTALYFAVGFIAIFVIGGITGIFLAVFPVDWQLNDTYFVVAHFHYVLMGGSVFTVFCRPLLLVPEDHRPVAQRAARQGLVLADVHRLQRHVLRPARARAVGHAAADLHLSRRAGLVDLQPDLDDRVVHPRSRDPRDDRQRRPLLQPGRARRARSVEGQHAGVVYDLSPAREQLRRDPARALRRADA